MTEKIRLRLISQIKKKDSDNWIQRILKGGLTIALYPFVILFGIVIMFFALAVSIFQKRDKSEIKVVDEPWVIWTEIDGVCRHGLYSNGVGNPFRPNG